MECLGLQSQLDWWPPLWIHILPRGSAPPPWLTPCPLLWFLGLWRGRKFHVIGWTLFSWAPKSLQIVTAAMKLKDTSSLEGKLWPIRQHIAKQRHYFADKLPSSQSCGFSSSHIWMRELAHKESWVPKNWYFSTVVLEKTLESPLNSKEINPVNPKGNQPWIFIGRTDVEAEAPILWLSDANNWFTGKYPDAVRDWGQEEKGMTEDEMAGEHHWLWTWVWASSRSWSWTGKPGVLQSMGSQRIGHNWATELNWTEVN